VIPSAYKLQSQKPTTPREESRPISTQRSRAVGAQPRPALSQTAPMSFIKARHQRPSSFVGPQSETRPRHKMRPAKRSTILPMSMTAQDFVAKWRRVDLSERSAVQQH